MSSGFLPDRTPDRCRVCDIPANSVNEESEDPADVPDEATAKRSRAALVGNASDARAAGAACTASGTWCRCRCTGGHRLRREARGLTGSGGPPRGGPFSGAVCGAGSGASRPHSGRGQSAMVVRTARRDFPTVGQQLAGIVEENHAVTQQAPPLLGVDGDGVCGVSVEPVRRWARGPMWTHLSHLPLRSVLRLAALPVAPCSGRSVPLSSSCGRVSAYHRGRTMARRCRRGKKSTAQAAPRLAGQELPPGRVAAAGQRRQDPGSAEDPVSMMVLTARCWP